jgi:acetylcholinesterase
VAATSCAGLLTRSSGTLDCLRNLPQEELDYALNVTGVGPWVPVIDGDILQDHPTSQFSRGDFVKVPLLVGTTTDEGTDHVLYSLPPVQDDDTVRAILFSAVSEQKTNRTTAEIVDELMMLYPNNQTVGIPSLETWPHVIQPGDSYAEQLGAQYRRISAMVGDITMHWSRRRANQVWHKHGLPTWSYRFNVVHINAPVYRGSSHTDEVRDWPCLRSLG